MNSAMHAVNAQSWAGDGTYDYNHRLTNYEFTGITHYVGTARVNDGWWINPQPVVPIPAPVTTGWKCPGCGRCYAPGILVCVACEPEAKKKGSATTPAAQPATPPSDPDGTLNRRIKA